MPVRDDLPRTRRMVAHVILSSALAGIATGVLAAGVRLPPGKPLWSVFVLLALGIWAGGLWVAPAGPVHFGIKGSRFS